MPQQNYIPVFFIITFIITIILDFSDILSEDVEEKVKEAAEISMGTKISEDDILNIRHLCD